MSSNHKRMAFSQHMPSLIASQHRKISLDSANCPFPEEASPSSSFDSQLHEFSSCDKKQIDPTQSIAAAKVASFSESWTSNKPLKEQPATKVTLNLVPGIEEPKSILASAPVSPSTDSNSSIISGTSTTKNMSKAAMLRHLFFSQNPTNSASKLATDSNKETTENVESDTK